MSDATNENMGLITIGSGAQGLVPFDESALYQGIEGEGGGQAIPFLNIVQDSSQVEGGLPGDVYLSYGKDRDPVVGRAAVGYIVYVFGTRSGWANHPNKRSFRKFMAPRERDKTIAMMRKANGGNPVLCASRSGVEPDARFHTANRQNQAAPDQPFRLIDWRVTGKKEIVQLPTRWGGDHQKTTEFRRFVDIDEHTSCWNCQLGEWLNRDGERGVPPLCQPAPRALLWIHAIAGVPDWEPQLVWYEANGQASRLFYGGKRDEDFRKQTRMKPLQWFTHFKKGSPAPNCRISFGGVEPIYLPLMVAGQEYVQTSDDGTEDAYFLPLFYPMWERISTLDEMIRDFGTQFAQMGVDIANIAGDPGKVAQVLSAAIMVRMTEVAQARWAKKSTKESTRLAQQLSQAVVASMSAPTLGHNKDGIVQFLDLVRDFQEPVIDEAGNEVYSGVRDAMYPPEAAPANGANNAAPAASSNGKLDYGDAKDEAKDEDDEDAGLDWDDEDEAVEDEEEAVEDLGEFEDPDDDDYDDDEVEWE